MNGELEQLLVHLELLNFEVKKQKLKKYFKD